ncbi:hypothetical protein BBJ28_00015632 [Nothophytophthora sp. Chile5]|nr:hypothetical protein BBJ28_00015632 [Nothophytophthora sp. Chile5]
MLIEISAIVATSLAIAHCFADPNVALSASSSTQAIEEGFSTAAWTPLPTANYSIIASSCDAQEWTISHDKASALWLHFSSIDLASGAQLLVSALDGSASQTLESQTSGVTTTPISGNGVTLKFMPPTEGCNSSTSSMLLSGMSVEYAEDVHERICGANDTMKNVACYASESHADKMMANKAKAVMRTKRANGHNGHHSLCTAWLWGNQGHIVTNNHCISSQEMVDATHFEFDVQTASCNESCTPATCPIGESLVGKGNVVFIQSDAALDYAVMQITTDVDYFVSTYGYLRIRWSAPIVGEEIYIPQHPRGGPKKIATRDNDLGAKIAAIRNINYSVTSNGVTFSHLIGYVADRDHGSSGSPVISRGYNTVVGLHRIGECGTDNAATPSDQLAVIFLDIVSDNDGYVD